MMWADSTASPDSWDFVAHSLRGSLQKRLNFLIDMFGRYAIAKQHFLQRGFEFSTGCARHHRCPRCVNLEFISNQTKIRTINIVPQKNLPMLVQTLIFASI